MNYTHDLIVIGAGSGGLGCAGFGSSIGLNVALIDKTAKAFGGDCLNYGCVPSKAILHVASLFAGGKEAEAFGLKTEGKADFKKVMEYVHSRQEVIRAHETPEYFAKEFGTETIVGTAAMTGRNEVSVNGRKLTAPNIVLATGSVPRKMEVPGIDQVKQWDNESVFWELDELPEHLLVVGGGPISCELSQAFTRLGSKVTLLVRGERLNEKDPEVMGDILARKLEEEGVDIRFNTEIGSFTNATTALLKDGGAAGAGNAGRTLEFTHLLVAIGRKVRTEGLGLEQGGVKVEKGKIVTDDRYRTTNSSVYAIGDAWGGEQFSHGAEFHNTQLWNNLISPIKKKHNLDKFAWVTFTDPEIATFGMTPKRFKEKGIDFETRELSLKDDDRAIAADFRGGHLIVYLSKGWWGGGKVLGGSLAAPAAGEMIQTLHYLQTEGKKYSALTNMIYPYPVASRIVQKGARQGASDMLTSGPVPKILRWAYRLVNR
ncbi:NAD(P)/FAD-dependent oxidoreductase [Neolewinella aurantiaca]|uniref:NAD(P)/FAD-dependent oxidoreductase n=1 Tax=Neolewinella aurantiaca TaxID=2602767 RepID=A0A5C7FJN4_9BACT|nr:FAD-dependent oxidoreductase [Neolewinella aurantiaca]TXF90066.1 NAD(P)/FAD-dependent oxidoreductase [Neolewinella aurantiaca]